MSTRSSFTQVHLLQTHHGNVAEHRMSSLHSYLTLHRMRTMSLEMIHSNTRVQKTAMAWTQFRRRNSGRTFPTASTSLHSWHHHRCHRARSFVVENVHTCSHVERPLPSDTSDITLCSFAQPADGGIRGTRLTARWKLTDFSYCSIYLMCKPALIKNHWLIRYFVFLQDQVGS